MNVAEILRKPDTAMTAEDAKIIAARVVAEEVPSGSSSRPDPANGAKVEDGVRKAVPKAVPAVIRKIAKAPPEPPPRRPTPPMILRPKGQKGHQREQPNGFPLNSGLEKGKAKEVRKESSIMNILSGSVLPEFGDWDTCPHLLPMLSPRKMSRQMVRDKSLFGETNIGTSEKLIGRGANARLSGLATLTLNGMTMLGRVSLHFLMRTTAIMREMVTLCGNPRSQQRVGSHYSPYPKRVGQEPDSSPHGQPLNNRDRRPNYDGAPGRGQHDWDDHQWDQQNEQSQDRRNEEDQRRRVGR